MHTLENNLELGEYRSPVFKIVCIASHSKSLKTSISEPADFISMAARAAKRSRAGCVPR